MLAGYLQLPVAELVALLVEAGEWLTPGGRLIYVGHAREGLTHGRGGGPQDPEILPSLAELATAAADFKVNALAHVVRADGRTVDVLLDCERWA